MERSFLWKSTTPFPSSPWENPRLPWKAFGPQRESSRKRRVRPCIPMGNLCSHPLPPVPTLNLTGDFLFFAAPSPSSWLWEHQAVPRLQMGSARSVSWLETAGAGCGKLGQHGGTASTFPASPEAASELLAAPPMPEEQTRRTGCSGSGSLGTGLL